MNKYFNYVMICALILSIPNCAGAITEARRSFILAHPHGWIEISVKDRHVPAKPLEDDRTEIVPLVCVIEAFMNNERYLSEYIKAFGDAPPYSIDIGYRFPAPVGYKTLNLTYSNCRVDEETNKVIRSSYPIEIEIKENFMTPIEFDGERAIINDHRTNDEPSLKSINETLKRLEEQLKSKK